MDIPIYQVDAFTSEVFSGNPAAVCPLSDWMPDSVLQSIAMENNLSETAFFVRQKEKFAIRWFTPLTEVDLCGHATLASAHVLFEELDYADPVIRFTSRSGLLTVTRDNELIALDFPSKFADPGDFPRPLINALGIPPAEMYLADDYLAVYDSAEQIRRLQPDMEILKNYPRGVIATAPGTDCDFVSRFFGPSVGIPEDPVTGSAHCILAPFWSGKLGKTRLVARQISARGGLLHLNFNEDRTTIAGLAVTYLRGQITV